MLIQLLDSLPIHRWLQVLRQLLAALRLLLVPENAPDLMLIDVEMPGMSGFELFTEIRNKPEFKDIPIAFLTGNSQMSSVRQGIELGANGYIIKPFKSNELMVKVCDLLNEPYEEPPIIDEEPEASDESEASQEAE
ncbi:hypothetical protein FACS189499_09520 [Clostridia bacterium]|nr:hypothetical protein FACS189499_09520 [Clostridia bacterium]